VNEKSSSDSELTLNMTVTAAFGASCTFPQSFHYAGYLVAPAHDNTASVPNAGYPGGMLTVSEDCTNTPCQHQLIWAITPDSSSQPNTTTRGLGTLYAFTALPNTYDIFDEGLREHRHVVRFFVRPADSRQCQRLCAHVCRERGDSHLYVLPDADRYW
jgi:hypothetical protein